MRTATAETVRTLRRAIGDAPYSRWARLHDIKPVTVRDALTGAPMSARRENTIRAAVDLPPLRWQVVELLEGQRVITPRGPERYKARAIRLPPKQADKLDEFIRGLGYKSFNEFWRAELARNIPLD